MKKTSRQRRRLRREDQKQLPGFAPLNQKAPSSATIIGAAASIGEQKGRYMEAVQEQMRGEREPGASVKIELQNLDTNEIIILTPDAEGTMYLPSGNYAPLTPIEPGAKPIRSSPCAGCGAPGATHRLPAGSLLTRLYCDQCTGDGVEDMPD